ncbi:MAG: AI-2E family transporter [Burkholderiaceae bacterium]
MHIQKKTNPTTTASYILTGLALLFIMEKSLLAAFFSGLLVYSLVHMLTPFISKRINSKRAKILAVAILGTLIVTILSLAIWGMIVFFRSDAGSVQTLLQKLADIIEASRNQIPEWIRAHLPEDTDSLREMISAWLREHAIEAKTVGEETGRTVAHILIGMIVGAMVALHESTEVPIYKSLATSLHIRMLNISEAFQKIVFAQVRIAAINATLVAVYLIVILPISGIHLPLTKSLIAITFFVGLIPVVGNLISNTVLVIVALSHSLNTAVASLIFMIVIHKLEYFLNAKIIGAHINARAWELLIAMLVMESVFGLPGVIAAPVFYAYLKKELMDRGLV